MACRERSYLLWLSISVHPYKQRVSQQPIYICRPHSYHFHAQSQFLSSHSIQKRFRLNLMLFDVFHPFWPLDRISSILPSPGLLPCQTYGLVSRLFRGQLDARIATFGSAIGHSGSELWLAVALSKSLCSIQLFQRYLQHSKHPLPKTVVCLPFHPSITPVGVCTWSPAPVGQRLVPQPISPISRSPVSPCSTVISPAVALEVIPKHLLPVKWPYFGQYRPKFDSENPACFPTCVDSLISVLRCLNHQYGVHVHCSSFRSLKVVLAQECMVKCTPLVDCLKLPILRVVLMHIL